MMSRQDAPGSRVIVSTAIASHKSELRIARFPRTALQTHGYFETSRHPWVCNAIRGRTSIGRCYPIGLLPRKMETWHTKCDT